MLIILFVVVFLLVGILFLRRTYGILEKTGIPVMTPSLFLGSEPFLKHKINYIELDRENRRKYGRVWAAYEMCEPWVTVADPALIKAITVKNFENFSAHWGVGTMESKFVTLDQAVGQEWKDLRRGLTPTFTSGKIKGMLALIGSSVDNMVEHLEEKTREWIIQAFGQQMELPRNNEPLEKLLTAARATNGYWIMLMLNTRREIDIEQESRRIGSLIKALLSI